MRVRSGSPMLHAKELPTGTVVNAQAIADWRRMAPPFDTTRRHSRFNEPDLTFSFGPFRLIPARQLLLRDAIPIRVGARALTLLIALVKNRGELVTREELMATTWPKLFVHESNLKVNMANLRRSLGDTQKQPIYIATVIGRGYQFVGSVEIGTSSSTDKECRPGPRGILGAAACMRDRRLG